METAKLNRLMNQDVYIFGAGKRGITILSILESASVNIVGFIDNNPSKQGKYICNNQ